MCYNLNNLNVLLIAEDQSAGHHFPEQPWRQVLLQVLHETFDPAV